jgi:Esterase/lipase
MIRRFTAIAALVLVCVALFSVASCDKLKEKPEVGRYYDVEADGNHYFVWLDEYDLDTAKGHYYASEGDSMAFRHDFTALMTRRSITIHSDGTTEKLKSSRVSYSPYEEPPFEEGDWKLYRKPSYMVSVTRDISYGHAEGYWTSLAGAEQDVFKVFSKGYVKSFKKHDLDLTLDLYRPDGLSGKKPLILFIHGGAFYIGYKDEPAYIDFCKYFASMGYVTASINYRLGFHVSKNEIERAGYVALQDAHAALRFLVAHADEYDINPDLIYVAGSSAGGITALNLAFMRDDERPGSSRGKKAFLINKADLGDIATSGNDLRTHFNIVAIANMWGAVSDLNLLNNSHTAIVSFHGDKDTTVPYAEGYPLSSAGDGVAKMLSEEMFGSACIDKKAEEIGLRHHFYSFPGEAHAFNTDKNKQPNANHTFIKERIKDFFFEEQVPEQAAIHVDGGGRYSVTGRGISNVQWKAEGGFILSSSSGKVRVLWCADKPHALTAVGKYNNSMDWLATL